MPMPMLMRLSILAAILLAPAYLKAAETITLANNANLLEGRRISPAYEEGPIFAPSTHGRSGLFEIVFRSLDSAEIGDPTAGMEEALVRHLAARFGAAGLGTPLRFGSDKPTNLAAWARDNAVTNLIVDIDMRYWALEWWSSSVAFNVMFLLVDPVSGQIIARHRCDLRSPELEHGPSTPSNPFPQDEASTALLADNAAPVKAIITELADACVEAIKSSVL